MNDEDSRYCTRCGSILKRIFCSACGTANPEGLGNCLQCGSSLPDMSEIRWAPSVRVIRPTEAMTKKEGDQSV
jgi:predicted ATP-dependent serine protease